MTAFPLLCFTAPRLLYSYEWAVTRAYTLEVFSHALSHPWALDIPSGFSLEIRKLKLKELKRLYPGDSESAAESAAEARVRCPHCVTQPLRPHLTSKWKKNRNGKASLTFRFKATHAHLQPCHLRLIPKDAPAEPHGHRSSCPFSRRARFRLRGCGLRSSPAQLSSGPVRPTGVTHASFGRSGCVSPPKTTGNREVCQRKKTLIHTVLCEGWSTPVSRSGAEVGG